MQELHQVIKRKEIQELNQGLLAANGGNSRSLEVNVFSLRVGRKTTTFTSSSLLLAFVANVVMRNQHDHRMQLLFVFIILLTEKLAILFRPYRKGYGNNQPL